MPFPTRLINEGETIALDLRPHWWFFAREILLGIPLLVLIALATKISSDAYDWLTGALTIFFAVWVLYMFLRWIRTYFVVTDQRVIYRTGILARHGVEIPLERINNINFHQGVWERVIGAGDLEIQSAGEQGTTLFENVRHPDGVQQEVYRQMEGDATRDAGRGADAIGKAVADAVGKAGGGGGGADVPEQIEKLAKLRDAGTITSAEFENKKADLLERM
jgi:membrane protein YdbS with pleckstrin-like domain